MDSLENKDTLAATELAGSNDTQAPVAASVEVNATTAESAEAVEEPTAQEEVQDNSDVQDYTAQIEKIVADFQQLMEEPLEQVKEQAEALKNQFYKLVTNMRSSLNANAEAAEEPTEEPAAELTEPQEAEAATEEAAATTTLEQTFRALLQQYKEKKALAHKQHEEELEQNRLRKENIILQMKEMTEQGTADVQDNIKKFKELQQEWKQIGAVPQEVATTLTKQYNLYQEQFYDLVKINYELRDYDFKKNLELKTQLIELAEQLKNQENVVDAFRQLQQLHEEWSQIGPVARELREDIWNRFKEASTVINKRHQDHFEQLHKREEDNLQQKLAIIDQIKAIDTDELTTNKQWDEAAALISELQAKWRTIGFAPKKHNQLIYDEYRQLCDEFFQKRTAFYRQLKDTLGDNLQKKRSLLDQAEALKDSSEWKEATEQFVKLQQEWKQIGPVARKYSDDIWKRFQAACDTFFERKKAETQDQRSVERDNLEQKKAIIQQIADIATDERDKALKELRELTQRFNQVGHVPFREKDKIYKQFRAAADKIFDALQVQASERRLESFARSVAEKTDDALQGDRKRLVRQYENLQQEIKTAENNILFFTSKSGKGNQLVDDMQKKIQDLKRQLTDLEQKINLIDTKLDEE